VSGCEFGDRRKSLEDEATRFALSVHYFSSNETKKMQEGWTCGTQGNKMRFKMLVGKSSEAGGWYIRLVKMVTS
jgi:hypothetical protein